MHLGVPGGQKSKKAKFKPSGIFVLEWGWKASYFLNKRGYTYCVTALVIVSILCWDRPTNRPTDRVVPRCDSAVTQKVSNFKPHYMLSLFTGLRALLYSACTTIPVHNYIWILHTFEFYTYLNFAHFWEVVVVVVVGVQNPYIGKSPQLRMKLNTIEPLSFACLIYWSQALEAQPFNLARLY